MKWGLVLSGGAAHGIANAGVIDMLERHDLHPDCIAGSSMGAIVGGLYALGHSPSTLHALIEKIGLTNIATWSEEPLKDGLHGGFLRQSLSDHLAPLIGDACIADCKIPFVCIAAKIREPIRWHQIVQSGFTEHVREAAEPYIFPQETLLLDALLASSAIPVVFSPVKIGNDAFIDIVHFGAIPARSLRERFHPDIVIATDTVPRYDKMKNVLPPGWQEFLEQGYESLQESRDACDLIIRPRLEFGAWRFDKARGLYEAGKRATEDRMQEIEILLSAKQS